MKESESGSSQTILIVIFHITLKFKLVSNLPTKEGVFVTLFFVYSKQTLNQECLFWNHETFLAI